MIENPTEEQLKRLKGIIYCIENKIDGKCYIGQTLGTFYSRYRNFVDLYVDKSIRINILLKRAIKKYGIKYFKVTILEYGLKEGEEINKSEIYYIKEKNSLFPNGYNLNSGGGQGRKMTRAAVEKAVKNRLKKIHKLKDKSGEMYEFNNITGFARKIGTRFSAVWKVLHKEILQVNGFFHPDTDIRIKRRTLGDNGKRLLKDAQGKIHEIFDLKVFCKENNLNTQSIGHVFQKRILYNKGWSLPETPPKVKYNRERSWKIVILIKDKIEYMVDDTIEFIKKFHMKRSSLYNLFAGRVKSYKGFVVKEVIR